MIFQPPAPIIKAVCRLAKRLFVLVAAGCLWHGSVLAKAITLPADTTADVFIKVQPSKPKAYKGEVITVKYLLYFAKSITDPQTDLNIKFKDCYTEEYPDNGPTADEKIGKRLYHVVLLKKFLLIPQTEGSLKLPGTSINIKMASAGTDFFGNERSVIKRISARAISLPVIDLPAKTDATQFSGAVGNFSANVTFEPSKKFSNILMIHFNIKGNGNLKFSSISSPTFPAGIDPSAIPNMEKDSLVDNGMYANHTYSFQLISNYRGKFNIVPIEFLYFSPDQKRYIKYTSPGYEWQVDKGAVLPKSFNKTTKGINIKADPILYTKMHIGGKNDDRYFFRSKFFYYALALTGLMYLLGLLFNHQRKQRGQNLIRYNFKTARRRAAKATRRLKLLSGKMGQDVFNKQLADILREYLKSKNQFLYPDNAADINIHLKNDKLPANLQAQVTTFFEEQNQARFAPHAESRQNRKLHCLQLINLIRDLDGHVK